MRRKGGDGRRRSGARWNAAARHRILGTAAGFGILRSSRSTSVRACLSVACDRLSWLPVTELAGSCLLFSIMAIHPLSGSGCEHGQEADRVYDEVRRCQPTQQEFQLSDSMMHRHVSTSVGFSPRHHTPSRLFYPDRLRIDNATKSSKCGLNGGCFGRPLSGDHCRW